MSKALQARLILVAFLVIGLLCGDSSAQKPADAQEPTDAEPTEGEKLFALKIKTLFVEKCNACHGDNPEEIQGGLNMLSRDALIQGGDSYAEEVLMPGQGEKSFLYIATTRSVTDYEMPPKEAEKLTEEQTWWIRDWIDQGAPWPDEQRVAAIRDQYAEGEIVKTSGGLGDDWTNRRYKSEHLWAYRPLMVERLPKAVHPINWYVDQKLEELGIEPAPDATSSELIRRMSFGLTGLPPDLDGELVRRFDEVYDPAPHVMADIYASHLMNTPQYGEHFGRMWLDVARYADSAGFANDYARPNAWRYRDYVIRSFNRNLPYNEFVRQQIAGDEIDASNSANLVATGFLRMGPWEQTGMSVFRVTRQQWLDDVTDSVGQAFLAHPLQCCKCHDHKFDPLPTRDYYSMMAVFSTTQFADRDAPFLPGENKTGFAPIAKWTKAKIAAYNKQRKDLNDRVNKNRQKESGDAKVGDNGLDPGDEASLSRLTKNISRHDWELDKTKPIAFAVHTGKTIVRKNVSARLKMPKSAWEKGIMDKDTILTGGDAFAAGDPVHPAPISAAMSLGEMRVAKFPDGQGKRREALANWIVDKRNPLTARVIVNRVWSWHFGKGLAANPNNFGATGGQPSHPALLDYLAYWFIENNWSIKKLNQMIVTSEAYRRSSRHEDLETLDAKDPKREYYAVFTPRRLTAEEFRDAMLAASGELNPQVGGVPCRPEINREVAMQPRQIMGGTASVYEPDSIPKLRNRRSIYAEKIRGLRDPFFETFNQPGTDKSCELRETSTVAPQALTLMNAQSVQNRSLAFAARLLKEHSGSKESAKSRRSVIQRAFRLALSRNATKDEQRACLDHWTAATKEEKTKTYEATKYATETQRTVMAEKTGEPYDFTEKMPAFENYVPDLQPHQVDANTRGLAQVCLVLFNSNEFAYLD